MSFPLKRFTVSGNSMLPILKSNQDVLVCCWFNKLKIGDIVVVRKNGRDIIKKITKINDHQIWITGDNKGESTDSRKFGWIKKGEIIGKVVWY